jgi:hypothetical protein
MSEQTWSLLAKSQDDPETIEEAIDRLILAHKADPTAHLGPTESLASHKAAEVIDHLAGSVVADKMANFSVDFLKLSGLKLFVISNFESLDGWNWRVPSGPPQAVAVVAAGYVYTTAVANNEYRIGFKYFTGASGVDWTKNNMFQTAVRVYSTTAQLAYIACGDNKYYGFKIVNGTLYACHNNGSTETLTEITGYTLMHMNVYRAEFTHGSNIKFYINETLVAEHAANLPINLGTEGLFSYYIKTTDNVAKILEMNGLFVSFDRNA